ncbi:MAG: hypothetical protein JSW07_11395, partial [bacterium]
HSFNDTLAESILWCSQETWDEIKSKPNITENEIVTIIKKKDDQISSTDFPHAWALGTLYLGTGKYYDAILYFKQYIKLGQKIPGYHRLSEAYYRLGCISNAINILKEANNIDPHNELTIALLGQRYEQVDYDSSLYYYLKLIELAPEVSATYIRIIDIYIKQDNYREALDYIDTTIYIAPFEPILHLNKALCLLKLKKDGVLDSFIDFCLSVRAFKSAASDKNLLTETAPETFYEMKDQIDKSDDPDLILLSDFLKQFNDISKDKLRPLMANRYHELLKIKLNVVLRKDKTPKLKTIPSIEKSNQLECLIEKQEGEYIISIKNISGVKIDSLALIGSNSLINFDSLSTSSLEYWETVEILKVNIDTLYLVERFRYWKEIRNMGPIELSKFEERLQMRCAYGNV